MQDNELDKLINDAANQHHPPYDDEAWGKMLVLLDKHLPQKKDRRRPFIFLLLFLLLGTSVLLGVLQPWNSSKNTIANTAPGNAITAKAGGAVIPGNDNTGNTVAITPGTTVNNAAAVTPATTAQDVLTAGGKKNTPADITATAGNSTTKARSPQAQSSGDDEVPGPVNKNKVTSKSRSVIKIKRPGTAAGEDEAGNLSAKLNKKPQGKPDAAEQTVPASEEVTATEDKAVSPSVQPIDAAVTVNKEAEKNKEPEKKDSVIAKQQTTVTASVNKKDKKNRSFTNNFALTFSTGADMSFVELNNPGKTKLFYGAGAAYSIGKHLKVGAGFYVSKKIYQAAPYQYKFPNGAVYPYLKEINADCNVYEIPLNVYYNFKQHKNHSWFAGAGISSLLMKKEHYDYLYKTPTGQSYTYARTVVDENKHYFSVVTISAGYQYKLNNHISLIAEPYFKLPLGGVGAGQIKLNSTGLLFTAAVKPFARSKK